MFVSFLQEIQIQQVLTEFFGSLRFQPKAVITRVSLTSKENTEKNNYAASKYAKGLMFDVMYMLPVF